MKIEDEVYFISLDNSKVYLGKLKATLVYTSEEYPNGWTNYYIQVDKKIYQKNSKLCFLSRKEAEEHLKHLENRIKNLLNLEL